MLDLFTHAADALRVHGIDLVHVVVVYGTNGVRWT